LDRILLFYRNACGPIIKENLYRLITYGVFSRSVFRCAPASFVMNDYQRFSAVLNKELEKSRRRVRALSRAFIILLLLVIGAGFYLFYPDPDRASSDRSSSESNVIQRPIPLIKETRPAVSKDSETTAFVQSEQEEIAPQRPTDMDAYAGERGEETKLSPEESQSELTSKIELLSLSGDLPKQEPLADHLDWLLDEFARCRKSVSTDPANPCNFFVAQALERLYGIRDFSLTRNTGQGNAPGIYFSNQRIIDYVLEHDDQWFELGAADDQRMLEQVQRLANEGAAVLAFREGGVDEVVALIMPGELRASSTWGSRTPNSLSFLPRYPEGSYVGKSLSFAWKKKHTPNVKFYCRSGGAKISVASKKAGPNPE